MKIHFQPEWIATNVDLRYEAFGATEEIIKLDRDILKSISGVENDLGLRYIFSKSVEMITLKTATFVLCRYIIPLKMLPLQGHGD